MSIHFVRQLLITCIISLAVFGLIYFLSPNRNVQLGTLIIIKCVGAVGIIAEILFVILISRKKEKEF